MKKHFTPQDKAGFTLVELLVSMAILSLLLVMMGSMVSQTSSMWSSTRGKIEQFREARDGFEAMTRRISQATLNTYWDYEDRYGNIRTGGTSGNLKTFEPYRYARQSELRFICGPSSELLGTDAGDYFTHSIFFQAPLGVVGDTSGVYGGLQYLLNAWGYYIEYKDDSDSRPSFITRDRIPFKKRFRLMEFIQPSEFMSLYQFTSGSSAYSGYDWFVKTGRSTNELVVNGANTPSHVLADNIIALIILPKLSSNDQASGNYTDASLSPGYFYSSAGKSASGSVMTTMADKNLNPKNQLPPVVQVTMVAIDEASALRMTEADNNNLQNRIERLFTLASAYEIDLKRDYTRDVANDPSLEAYLIQHKINYRIFTTNVSIKAAKWSREQKN